MRSDRLDDAPPVQGHALRGPCRLAWCLLVAALAHLSLGMYRVGERSVLGASAATRTDRAAQAIGVDLTELPEGPAPGGGSPEPEPEAGKRAIPEQPVLPTKPAPAVARAPETQRIAALADVVADKPDLDDGEPVDPYELVTTAAVEGQADLEAVRPKAVRRRLLDPHRPPTATAPEEMATVRETSRYRGYGPGAHGGPGGPGRGWRRGSGVVRRSFAFGGPRGAFRADVCFIPQGTTALSRVTRCPRQATFFTDALNVSPRKFSEGFPGVSDQNEWFAIRYKGTFRVRDPGQYTFRLVSDDGAVFYVDGYRIIDNDGIHPPSSRTGNMRLAAGEHTMFVSYFQGPRFDIALQLFVTPPGRKERLFGPEI